MMKQNIDQPILTITQLNQQVRFLLEQSFPTIWVEGEISNFSAPSSGHWYFSLKDISCQVRCALFRNQQRLVTFKPKDGVHVLAKARVSLYEGRGEFQLIIEHMEEAGFGRLQRAFEQLKTKLSQEGLFNPELKKSLPYIPKQIGIITSPTGAAIRDIIHVLARRFPIIPIIIYPTLVQGDEAASQIVQAIQIANQRKECDVLILTRGGGSLEDLWPFNEEIVARAIAASKLPIISAVGHQIDFTIADFVADIRAATPSAAAEIIAPEQTQLLLETKQLTHQMFSKLEHLIQEKQQKVDWLEHRLKQQHPKEKIKAQIQRLRQFSQQLMLLMNQQLKNKEQQLQLLHTQLKQLHPAFTVTLKQKQLQSLTKDLTQAMQTNLNNKQQKFLQLIRVLQNISPLATLARGYAIAKTKAGKIILSTKDVQPHDEVIIERNTFSLTCEVKKISTTGSGTDS